MCISFHLAQKGENFQSIYSNRSTKLMYLVVIDCIRAPQDLKVVNQLTTEKYYHIILPV